MIKILNKEIDKNYNQMLKLFNNYSSLTKNEEQEIIDIVDNLRTISGVSNKTLFTIIEECGNLDRFKNTNSFIGYLELSPTLEQSDNNTKYGKLAKCSSKLAKKALYQLAIAAIRDNFEINKLYCNTLSKGKAKKEVIIVARKLATIILAIYKQNTPYNPNSVFNQKVT